MMQTSSLSVNKLQDRLVLSLGHFTDIKKIKVQDNDFIQKKINQISEQKVEFRKFAYDSITHVENICTYAEYLTVFVKCCEDNDISNDGLLEFLRLLLNDSRKYKKNAKSLKDKLETIENVLTTISKEVFQYNEKITKKRNNLNAKIKTAKELEDGAASVAKASLLVSGVVTFVAVAAIPFTGGASLAALAAEAVVEVGAFAVLSGMATSTLCTTVAGASSVTGVVLNYELKGVREKFSQFLKEIAKGLGNIVAEISLYESHWVEQINIIEGIIGKLELGDRNGRQLIKIVAMTIAPKAKGINKKFENYCVEMKKALYKDSLNN